MKPNKKIIIALSFVFSMQNLMETQIISSDASHTDTSDISDTGKILLFVLSAAAILITIGGVSHYALKSTNPFAYENIYDTVGKIATEYEKAGYSEKAQSLRSLSNKISRLITFSTTPDLTAIYSIISHIIDSTTEQTHNFMDELMISRDIEAALKRANITNISAEDLKQIKNLVELNKKYLALPENSPTLKQLRELKLQGINEKIKNLEEFKNMQLKTDLFNERDLQAFKNELKTIDINKPEDYRRLNELSDRIDQYYSKLMQDPKIYNQFMSDKINNLQQNIDLITSLKGKTTVDSVKLHDMQNRLHTLQSAVDKGGRIDIFELNKLSHEVYEYHNNLLKPIEQHTSLTPLPKPVEIPAIVHPTVPPHPTVAPHELPHPRPPN